MGFRGLEALKDNLQEPRGLPKYAEVAQNIVVCGLDCGLKKSTNFVAIMPFPRDAFLRKDHSEVAVWKTAKRVLHIDHLFARMQRLNTYEAKTRAMTKIGSTVSQSLPLRFRCE